MVGLLAASWDKTMTDNKRSDTEIDGMDSGDFYHYMLDKDHVEWARHCNRMGKLGLVTLAVEYVT